MCFIRWAGLVGVAMNAPLEVGLTAMATSKRRPVPKPRRSSFAISAPKKARGKSKTPEVLDQDAWRWFAVDDLIVRLRQLRALYRSELVKVQHLPREQRRAHLPPIRDRYLVRLLNDWVTTVCLPRKQKALSMHLAIVSWNLVRDEADRNTSPIETAIRWAMHLRGDGMAINEEQLSFEAERSRSRPEIRAHRIYNILAEGSTSAIQPDSNTRRKSELARLIHETNPFIDDD